MNYVSGFSKILSKFYTICYGLFEFSKHLCYRTPLDGCFLRFRSTCFSEHLKVDDFFIKQPCYFFSEYFQLKNHPKRHIPSFSLPWWEGIPSLFFIVFPSLLFTLSLFKTFLDWKNKYKENSLLENYLWKIAPYINPKPNPYSNTWGELIGGQSSGWQLCVGQIYTHRWNRKVLVFLKRLTFNSKHYLHKCYLHKGFIFLNSKFVSSKLFQEVYWRTAYTR